MAAPEQVGIATELELNRLQETIQQALGEQAEELPPYPTYYFDPTLLHVEQLRWMNHALGLIVEQSAEGQSTREDDSESQNGPSVTPETSEDTSDEGLESAEEAEQEPEVVEEEEETSPPATTRKRR